MKMTAEQFAFWLRSIPVMAVMAAKVARERTAVSYERLSRERSPVKTGAMRGSILTKNESMKSVVKTNVHYALYVHEGTSKMPARPFMKEAVERSDDQITEIISQTFTEALEAL